MQTYQIVFDFKYVGKAAFLRQAFYERHLATLETFRYIVAGTGFLPFIAASGGSAMTAPITSPESLGRFFGTGGGVQFVLPHEFASSILIKCLTLFIWPRSTGESSWTTD
jgi:hypothetical protein